MKKNILIVILCSAGIISCTTQKLKNAESSSSKPVSKEMVKDSTCCFDVKKFEINAYNQKIFKENFKKPGYDAQYEEDMGDGKHIRQWTGFVEQEKTNTQEYIEDISKKWSPFNIQKRYDNLGRLKFWGLFFRNEGINKSYEYDESGKVTKITNYEERYKHSFANIREFLLKAKGIDIYDTRQAIARRVNHQSKINSEAYYDIYVLDKNNVEKDYHIVIFDDTLELKEYK